MTVRHHHHQPRGTIMTSPSPSPSTAAVQSARALDAAWRRAGWTPGLPPTVTEATLAIDRRVYRHLTCPGCKDRRRQTVTPWRRGREYRLLVACPQCGRGEEG